MLYHSGCQQSLIADFVQVLVSRIFQEVLGSGCGITPAKSCIVYLVARKLFYSKDRKVCYLEKSGDNVGLGVYGLVVLFSARGCNSNEAPESEQPKAPQRAHPIIYNMFVFNAAISLHVFGVC